MRQVAMMLALLVCTLAAPTRAAPTFPDRGRRAVVDEARLLSDADRGALEQRILGYVAATGHQLVVVTLPDLQGADVKDYGYQLLRHWALGDKQRNDGVILLLSVEPRKVRIEVGYGLEPVLTDALTSVILRDRVVPRLKQDDTIGALRDGADAIMQATGYTPPDADPQGASGVMQATAEADAAASASEPSQSADRNTEAFIVIGAFVGFFVFIIAVIILVSRIGRRRGWTGASGASSDSSSSSSSDWSSDSSSSSDSGFDSGGGSSGGGGSDSSY